MPVTLLTSDNLVFDLVHVATIHNSSIPSDQLLTPDALHQLQTRADQHEWNLAYNASSPIRAVAGAVLAAQIVQALNATLTGPAAKLNVQFGAYGTFMSFFGLAGLPAASPAFMGIVDYASSMIFELVTNASLPTNGSTIDAADVSVRFLFVNGTVGANNPLTPFPLFGQTDELLSWSAFAQGMNAFGIGDTPSWCAACGNSTGVCAPSSASSSGNGSSCASSGSGGSGGGVSTPVAGVIGALVTLVVILAAEGLVMGVAGLRLTRKRSLPKASNGASGAAVTQA